MLSNVLIINYAQTHVAHNTTLSYVFFYATYLRFKDKRSEDASLRSGLLKLED